MKYLSNPAALGLQYVEQWVSACKYIDKKNDTNDDDDDDNDDDDDDNDNDNDNDDNDNNNDDSYDDDDDDDVIHDKPSSIISNGFVTVNVSFSRLFLITTGFDKGAGCCALGEL